MNHYERPDQTNTPRLIRRSKPELLRRPVYSPRSQHCFHPTVTEVPYQAHVSIPTFLFMLALVSHTHLFVTPARVAAQDQEPDSVDRDYSDELPRSKPVEPEDALSTFEVADGFRMELVAAEPDVVDPVAMSFDENGRLFVVEMRDYSEHPDESLGRVRLLEDLNDDGFYETSHVFADGLSWPTAIFTSRSGVLVGAPPHLYFLRDTDNDNVADEKEIIFTGFGRSNVQGLMNSFRWGLDRRIHAATSSSGAVITKPGMEGQPLTLRGRDFAIDTIKGSIRPVAGGGQHGVSFNEWGEKFVCANSNHIQYIAYEDEYLSRNPFMSGMPIRLDISTDGPQADVFRSSPVEPWRIVRTRLRRQGIVPGPVERGGLAAGYFTGATGVTLYRGNAWGDLDETWAIIGDVGSNLIHRKRINDRGVLYQADRIDEESEFVTSTDNWFRPVQFLNGPDGALYVLDMYREVIEHPKSLPPVIKKHLDLDSGRDRGRIYRIVANDFERGPLPRLGNSTAEELVGFLRSDNGWLRDTASRLIYEKQMSQAIGPIMKSLEEEEDAIATIWLLSALEGLSALTVETIAASLEHEHPRVRRYALQISEPFLKTHGELVDRVLERSRDDDLRVRFQAAFTLGEANGPRRNQALIDMALRDVEHPYVMMAIQSSLASDVGAVLVGLLDSSEFTSTNSGLAFIDRLADQISRQRSPDDVSRVVEWLLKTPNESTDQLRGRLIAKLSENANEELLAEIQIATGGESVDLLRERGTRAMTLLRNNAVGASDQLVLMQQLRWLEPKDAIATLAELLVNGESAEIQAAAIQLLGRYEDDAIPALLFEQWATMTPARRRQAMEVLFSRDHWIAAVLQAIVDHHVGRSEIDMGRLRRVAQSDHPLAKRAGEILDSFDLSSRAEIVERYRESLSIEGDASSGATVFEKNCSQCHQVGGQGNAIGPSLEAMITRGEESVLINLLDPNREVNPAYVTYTITTLDGIVLTGMITEESSNTVTLQQSEGEPVSVLRLDIDEIQSTGLSLMPEGLEVEIDIDAMADLLAFLKSAR